jgi:nucleoside phosphorylase
MNVRTQAVFLFAMHAEAVSLLDRTNAHEIKRVGPMVLYEFSIAGVVFGVICCGESQRFHCDRIGTEAAMLAAHTAVSEFNTSWLISAGTCGAFDPRLRVGDLISAGPIASYYDHRVPLDAFSGYSQGAYPLYECELLNQQPEVHRGIVATGHSLDLSPRCQTRLEASGAIAKEMELAAVAQYADEFGYQASGLKVVSNAAGDHGHNEFSENLADVSVRLCDSIYHWCEALAAR